MTNRRVVVASLGAFARAVNATTPGTVDCRVRRERRAATCARVEHASFITRGFALHDVFAYGWAPEADGGYVQRWLRRSARLGEFCRRSGIVTVLSSEAGSDRGSGHPLCLYRAGERGFLLVMDVEPPAELARAVAVSPYAARLLRQAFGGPGPARGQYVAVPQCRQELEQTLWNLCDRFPPLRWVPTGPEGDPPVGWVQWPGAERRRITLRTGFTAEEWDIVLGVATWFKQRRRPSDPMEDVTLQWIPVSRSGVAPPVAVGDYKYVVEVPENLRPHKVMRPSAADVRVDLVRAGGDEVVLRCPTVGSRTRELAERLRTAARAWGGGIRMEQGAGWPRVWKVAFPVESDVRAYDAIAAVDRVVQVTEILVESLARALVARRRRCTADAGT